MKIFDIIAIICLIGLSILCYIMSIWLFLTMNIIYILIAIHFILCGIILDTKIIDVINQK